MPSRSTPPLPCPPSPAAWCSTFPRPTGPDLVYLYEVYRDDAAYEAHTRTAHFRDSRPLVEPLILEQEVFESDALALNPLR